MSRRRPGRGAAGAFVTVLPEPGGLVTVLAAAVVTGVRDRGGRQSVTTMRPEGTEAPR